MQHLILLGPQRLEPTVHLVMKEKQIDGDIAFISVGWQEREEEDEELRTILGKDCRVHNLCLHARCEEVYQEDSELFEAHRLRQDKLRALQEVYRFRLDGLLSVARHLWHLEGDSTLLAPERVDAIEAIRRLDAHHLRRLKQIHDSFESRFPALSRPAVQKQHEAIRAILQRCPTIAFAGGHVAVILNRIRMLAMESLFVKHNLIAWSAGAMALSERVVLFHDNPPQGAGNAEILDIGLGYFRGILPLPHARRRLHLDDAGRVILLAQRFQDAHCVALDEGSRLDAVSKGWRIFPRTRLLGYDGQVHEGTQSRILHPIARPVISDDDEEPDDASL